MTEQVATVSKGTREGFVEVSFPTKPDEAVRKELSLVGFRWNGKKSVWWGRVEALPERYRDKHGPTKVTPVVTPVVDPPAGSVDPKPVTPQLPPAWTQADALASITKLPNSTLGQKPKRKKSRDPDDRPVPGKQYHLTGAGKSIASGNTWAESECKPEVKGTHRLVDFAPLDGYEWKGNAFPPSSGWWSDGTLMLRHGFVDDNIEWQDVGKYKTPVADKIWKSLIARVTDGRWGTREVCDVKMYQHPEQDADSDSTKYVYLMAKDGKEPLVVMRQTWSFVKAHLDPDCEPFTVYIAGPKDPAIVRDRDNTPIAVVMPVHQDDSEKALKLYHAAIEADRPLLQDVPPAEKVTERPPLQIVAPPPVQFNPKILQLRPTPPPPAVPGGDLALAKAEANMAEIDKMLAELTAK